MGGAVGIIMILEVKQVTANGKNNFEIFENGQIIFRAQTPFYKLVTPIGRNAFHTLTLTDASGQEVLRTEYNVAENLAASVVPLSWMFTDSKKIRRYSVINNRGYCVGTFYFEQTGVADTRTVIEYQGRTLACYKRGAGKKEIVAFYEGDVQVGQLTKPNCVKDLLDCYLLHFTDYFPFRDIVSLFAVYYDFMYHSNSGKIYKGKQINLNYTFDKNSKMCNKNFIAETFGNDEDERVEQYIKDAYKKK